MLQPVITVRGNGLSQVSVYSITRTHDAYVLGMTSDAGELAAILNDDGTLEIRDNDFPNLRYNIERFRPLIEEAIRVANSTNKISPVA